MDDSLRCHGRLPIGSMLLLIAAAALVMSANGCGWLVAPPEQDLQAVAMLDRWEHSNAGLFQLKGIMQVQLDASGRRVSGRAAWAAVLPDRLRLEWLNPLGQPLLRFTADGREIVVNLPGARKEFRIAQNGQALNRLIHVPIGVADFLNILTGRPPMIDYAAAQIRYGEINGNCTVLLKNRWHGVMAELRAGADGTLQEMERYRRDGAWQYRIHWRNRQTVKTYQFAREIDIETAPGDKVSFVMDRLYPDVPVASELFDTDADPAPQPP